LTIDEADKNSFNVQWLTDPASDTSVRTDYPGENSSMIRLQGVFAAAVTPLNPDFTLAADSLMAYLAFLHQRGCHGALILGTTGEGPSLGSHQRLELMRAAISVRQEYPEFGLLAGTGTPSLDETIAYTRAAFDMGYDGVVVLPPYYFRKAGQDGLFLWFSEVIRRAVPEDGLLFFYHIPPLTGVSPTMDFFSQLKDNFPNQFAGLKDSSGDPSFCQAVGEEFSKDLKVFTGNDRLFSLSLQSKGSGCITAAASLISPTLRAIWDAYLSGSMLKDHQEWVDSIRGLLDGYAPFPPVIKALLAKLFGFPRWAVCPPLLDLPQAMVDEISSRLNLAYNMPQ
jgi:4-hydroxy-tetrahydrodipicolinate synthase